MVLTVIVAALFVVNQRVRRQVFAAVSQELFRSAKVFAELQSKELDLLAERSWVIAEAPHLKAAVDTGDSTTVQRVAAEIVQNLGSDVLIVAGHAGRILAHTGLTISDLHNLDLNPLLGASAGYEETRQAVLSGEQVFQLLSVPILTNDEISGVFMLGRVIAGKLIDAAYLNHAKGLVECDIAFLSGAEVRATTLGLSKDGSGRKQLTQLATSAGEGMASVEIENEEFIALRTRDGHFLLIKSVEQAFVQIMRPIEKTMVIMGGFAIIAALLISSFVSYGIVQPVQKLVQATEEITAGDYEHKLQVGTSDEIGRLTTKFDEMRQALRQKIAQLNERNDDLEQALQQLEATQKELVRSERLAATGKITAQLSHELNNPIHNIQSCLEAAQKKIAPDEPGREFVDLAYDEILRIGKLTRQMLDYYRPAAQKQRVNVNELLEDVLRSSDVAAQQGEVQIEKAFASDADEVSGSSDQLKQVFLNLLLNARDAMPDGGRIVVRTEQCQQALKVSFEDNGCGIPAQNLDKIFDAFFTTKAEANGVGLGLSVSYGIIQSHGGDIQVESEVGKGATFVVKIPLIENNSNV